VVSPELRSPIVLLDHALKAALTVTCDPRIVVSGDSVTQFVQHKTTLVYGIAPGIAAALNEAPASFMSRWKLCAEPTNHALPGSEGPLDMLDAARLMCTEVGRAIPRSAEGSDDALLGERLSDYLDKAVETLSTLHDILVDSQVRNHSGRERE
jgi:hypothetical protein